MKKNLQIGLGLVNTLTVSEFKAVMAHEFGHFSQRSMKLGSFVYNVNKVIYNMLYENKGFTAFLQGWGNLHWAIHIFMYVTVELVKGIQKILQRMYGFINKSYMSLSREMEFHADAVAASVSGGNHLIEALQKIEVSDACYNTVMQKANDWLKDKTIFENVYTKHHVVMTQYAKEYNLPLLNNVPQLSNDFYKNFQQSKINIKNQWASHPTREDREARLQQLQITAVTDNRSAWILFNEPAALQKQVTETLYKTIPADMREQLITDDIFKERYLTDIDVYNLPAAYNGYFDDHQIRHVDLTKLEAASHAAVITKTAFAELFSAEKTGLLKSLKTNQSDARILEAISNKNADIKTFDYNGEKYRKEDAPGILEKLKIEMDEQEKLLQEHEEKMLDFFYTAAALNSHEDRLSLQGIYLAHNESVKKTDEYAAICMRVSDLFAPLLGGQQLSIQAAEDMAAGLRKESNNLRPLLIEWVDKKVFVNNVPLNEKAMKFCSVNYLYFASDAFFDNELKHLHELTGETMQELMTYQLKSFKNLLEYQLSVYHEAVEK